MNEKQASIKGYAFTGSYGHDKEIILEKAKEIRKNGFRAVVVNTPPNPLSRGSYGMGYSVYADRRYFKNERLLEVVKTLQSMPNRYKDLEKEYDENRIKLRTSENNLFIEKSQLELLLSKD